MIERHMPSWVLEVVAIVAADQRFFDRRPDRDYRLRLAAPCEIAEAHFKLGMGPPPSGCRAFVGVRRIKGSDLYRVIGFAIDAAEVDFDEAAARVAYRRLEHQGVSGGQVAGGLWHAVPTQTGASS